MKIISFVIFCFSVQLAYSQLQSPSIGTSSIEDIFNKEFSKNQERKPIMSLITPPVVLPEWFFNPPQADQENFYAIGISDPWIDIERGNKQAKCRAFCLAGFMNKVSAKGLTDNYTGSDQIYKFEQICNFKTHPGVALEGVPVDSFVTKYMESIYLYRFTVGNGLNEKGSSIEYYKTAIGKNDRMSKLEKIELYEPANETKMLYSYLVKDNDFEILSIFDSDTIKIEPTIYQYNNGNAPKEDEESSEFSLFRKGLWLGYLQAFIENLDIAAIDIESRQKSVSDIYQNTDQTKSLKQLNRGVYNTSFTFYISSIELINKEMVIHFKTNK